MDADLEALPDDVEALKAALLTARARERKVLADWDAVAADVRGGVKVGHWSGGVMRSRAE